MSPSTSPSIAKCPPNANNLSTPVITIEIEKYFKCKFPAHCKITAQMYLKGVQFSCTSSQHTLLHLNTNHLILLLLQLSLFLQLSLTTYLPVHIPAAEWLHSGRLDRFSSAIELYWPASKPVPIIIKVHTSHRVVFASF